mgnify:CR=1 FL=1
MSAENSNHIQGKPLQTPPQMPHFNHTMGQSGADVTIEAAPPFLKNSTITGHPAER